MCTILEKDSEFAEQGDVSTARCGKESSNPNSFAQLYNHTTDQLQPHVFFASLTGTTEKIAQDLVQKLPGWEQNRPSVPSHIRKPILHDLSYTELDDYFINPPRSDSNVHAFYIILLPTYNIDTILDNFVEHLKETHHDFRIDNAPLRNILGYSIFGFGDKEGWPTEEEGFCSQAREVDKWMAKLTARKRAYPLGVGDSKSDANVRLEEWREGVSAVIREIAAGNGLGEGVPGSGAAVESDEESEDDLSATEEDDTVPVKLAKKKKAGSTLSDLEDLGRMINKGSERDIEKQSGPIPPAVDFTTYKKSLKPKDPAALKEMVPKESPTYNALTKQGYTIVGSHSGVKICRWTKSALRGRGSCYKFSFYGIKSHLCMETTPSLSCSNKCVFCWRHGTNPVGTTWRWRVDPPEEIFQGVTDGHYRKIKMMKGVPGVRAERFAEAMRIRHCALSLVGEPIFYPYINEFTDLLHKQHISSFLVCNAQHPDQLEALQHVTQLYVSIDASNKESLRKIDRPLHRDYWERFQRCLDILREKRFIQRTVFRLTLVKGFNIEDEVEGYADLVQRGLPCFVEVKGVTYCGTTTSSAGLSMQNVPFYEEVSAFVVALNAALQRRGLDYGIAAEHAHSCCVLIASTRFRNSEGQWCTLIDYDAFFKCLESGKEFTPEDYMGTPTPEWALWGNGGFDPRDERVDRKGRKKVEASVDE
ncbi:hypothetical protein K402DRAFT_413518 [Aulographum hederae CBS 113979]|uniref:S-adenosyl-L-methionine-dependent tRNA 4-demethylwyosine synthase n=1 Tax=Aulographum hederae CBS 113979 TaxID=1176131 RepID=A0A6G1GWG2_9PEZI|nr:hypothetical protein K402DRAFT_413518 [Aulographum hederae CBS 113979]